MRPPAIRYFRSGSVKKVKEASCIWCKVLTTSSSFCPACIIAAAARTCQAVPAERVRVSIRVTFASGTSAAAWTAAL